MKAQLHYYMLMVTMENITSKFTNKYVNPITQNLLNFAEKN